MMGGCDDQNVIKVALLVVNCLILYYIDVLRASYRRLISLVLATY